MKNLVIILALLFVVPVMGQDKIKVRFKISKERVFVNKVEWAKLEPAAGKFFLNTLAGEEFVSIHKLEYGTGGYDVNTGKEITHSYCEIKFIGTDIPEFEVDANYNEANSLMYKMSVLVDDTFVQENAIKFKDKYKEEVSEKHFLTKSKIKC
tara:strand:+ start:639 stop:1094 length:456 start_codon:yes stop_codon:yes gene_type:complete